MPSKMDTDKLQQGLRTKRFGRKIFFSREVDSTNDLAKELAALGATEGTVVVAEKQAFGRGRIGKEWCSPAGGLWFSVVLRPEISASDASKLVFAAGLAVVEALHELYSLDAETKWPNDVLVKAKKICGILSEMSTRNGKVRYVVIGIGVNVNFDARKVLPDVLRETATSIETELGRKVSLEQLFGIILEKLESCYDLFLCEGYEPVRVRWKGHAVFFGCRVEVVSQSEKLEGMALDVDGDGALVLKLNNGAVKRVFAGDVSLKRTRQAG